MSPAPADRRLGSYAVLRKLAEGGMGEVFLARAPDGAQVVLKRLKPDFAERPEVVELFLDEARIARHLAHPNVVRLLEVGQEGKGLFLALEYVPGQSLARVASEVVQRRHDWGLALPVWVVAEMARGLHYAHGALDEHGQPLAIVHRDVSPHNVLVSTAGEVKLADFGIARATNRRTRTRTGVLRGKFAYMSPEQADSRPLDARSDVFAAGVVLWEMTLRQRLFLADSEQETLRNVRHKVVPRPRQVDPHYPPALEAIVLAALERAPEARPASAAALEASLRGWLDGVRAADQRGELAALLARLFPDGGADAALADELSMVTEPTVPASSGPARPEVVEAVAVPPGRRKASWAQIAVLVALAVAAFVLGWLAR